MAKKTLSKSDVINSEIKLTVTQNDIVDLMWYEKIQEFENEITKRENEVKDLELKLQKFTDVDYMSKRFKKLCNQLGLKLKSIRPTYWSKGTRVKGSWSTENILLLEFKSENPKGFIQSLDLKYLDDTIIPEVNEICCQLKLVMEIGFSLKQELENFKKNKSYFKANITKMLLANSEEGKTLLKKLKSTHVSFDNDLKFLK